MRRVEPKVFVVAETRVNRDGMDDYLKHVGGTFEEGGVFLTYDDTTGQLPHSSSEMLSEFMGRLCYRSWKAGLNANVSKVREGNDKYLANVISTKHGSVLEHASVSFVFADVSRVFTHELVRHRVGVGISQESLRYVRLDDLGMWAPSCLRETVIDCPTCGGTGIEDAPPAGVTVDSLEICRDCHGKKQVIAAEAMGRVFEAAEAVQRSLATSFKLDDPGVPFETKKEVTSAMRRMAPDGLATTIGWSANMRTLRFVLALRTHRSAEEEIRLVFDQVGQIARERWPNLFADFKREEVKGIGEWTSENWKI